MIYLYILAGLWTFMAICWSVAFLSAPTERASKLERLVRAAETVAEAYRNHAR